MFRIAKSLFIIVAVAAIAVGATGAYFTDSVSINDNSLSTGTIAINVDGQHEWNDKYVFSDIKPGYVEHSDFVVTNEGSNPANITKVVSIPEEGDATLADVLDYHLSVEVLDGSTVMWFTTLYDYDVTLASLLGQDMFLGMLPAGDNWSMKVTESYRMKTSAGNGYQGLTMPFDILVKAEQLKGSIVLENKTGSDWDIIQGDGIQGTLNYGVMDTNFNFSFIGDGLIPSTSYTLVMGDDYPFAGGAVGSASSDGAGHIDFSGSKSFGVDQINKKVWLVPSTDDAGDTMAGHWAPATYLFETGLVDYYESGI